MKNNAGLPLVHWNIHWNIPAAIKTREEKGKKMLRYHQFSVNYMLDRKVPQSSWGLMGVIRLPSGISQFQVAMLMQVAGPGSHNVSTMRELRGCPVLDLASILPCYEMNNFKFLYLKPGKGVVLLLEDALILPRTFITQYECVPNEKLT